MTLQNDALTAEKEKLEQYYAELGKHYLQQNTGNLTPQFRGIDSQIHLAENRISQLKASTQNNAPQQNTGNSQSTTAPSNPGTSPQPDQQMYGIYPMITEEQLPAKFKPVAAWSYFGWSFVFSVPIIGWIVALIKAFGNTENVNLKNFARSMFCYIAILAILFLIIGGMGGCVAALL